MGTNYYIKSKPCPHCGRGGEEIHIGKSSGGWCFSLHVDELNNSLDDWKKSMSKPDTIIVDEYGREITKAEMLDIITKRSHPEKWNKTPLGYKSWDDMFSQNHAERGPHGLLRHKIDGRHCIAHGEGTWDLIVGEFS